MRWDKQVDLDLAIATPDGNIVDYQHPSESGGRLDLDANWLCDPSRDNVENIGWRDGTEPPGTYRVFANLNDACGLDDVTYEIVAVVCGNTYTNSGTFSATDENPGGQGREISGPRLAWSEGAATGLGQIALGHSRYVDSRTGGITGYDIETGTSVSGGTPAGFAQDTSNHQQDGEVSEYLIAMVLWDLDDPANEAHDPFNQERRLMQQSLFEVLPAKPSDRGVWFSDFVDFLDGCRCRIDPTNPAKRDADLRTLLNERKFPYDFATTGIGCGK